MADDVVKRLRVLLDTETGKYPAPWKPDGYGFIRDADGELVGEEAMERLARAAVEALPALLDVAEAARVVDGHYEDGRLSTMAANAMHIMRAALAKLQGGT